MEPNKSGYKMSAAPVGSNSSFRAGRSGKPAEKKPQLKKTRQNRDFSLFEKFSETSAISKALEAAEQWDDD